MAAGLLYGGAEVRLLKGAATGLFLGANKVRQSWFACNQATSTAKALHETHQVAKLASETANLEKIPQIAIKSNIAGKKAFQLNHQATWGDVHFGRQNPSHKISQLEGKLSEWLGKETKMIKNKDGDLVFLSKDRTKKVRFDLNHPAPHSNPHGHIEEFTQGKWNKSGPIYPFDVPHY